MAQLGADGSHWEANLNARPLLCPSRLAPKCPLAPKCLWRPGPPLADVH